jgi:hypothetical protein
MDPTTDTFTAFLAGIAAHASAQVPALRKSYYPIPSKIELTPALLVMSGGGNATLHIDHEGPGEQMWSGQVRGQILVDRARAIDNEVWSVDSLIFPLTDAFAIDATGHGIELPGFAHHVDRCVIADWFPQEGLEYGRQTFAGGDVYWDFKFHRVWDTE